MALRIVIVFMSLHSVIRGAGQHPPAHARWILFFKRAIIDESIQAVKSILWLGFAPAPYRSSAQAWVDNQAAGDQSMEKMAVSAGEPPAQVYETGPANSDAPDIPAKPGKLR